MRKKIFCLETEFDEKNLKSTATAEGILRYMTDYENFEYIYKKAPTEDAMYFYLDKILKPKYSSFEIIYLPTHSEPGRISANKNEKIDIQDFTKRYEGKFNGKIIHFGGCSLFNIDINELQGVKKRLCANIITGFTKDIYPIDAITFEMLLFSELQRYKSKVGYIKKRMYSEHPVLAKKLGFEAV